MKKKPLTKLSKDGELQAYVHNGYWRCMDNLNEKNQLEEILRKKNYMENKVILNSTELTGIMNRDEMNKLSLVVEEKMERISKKI